MRRFLLLTFALLLASCAGPRTADIVPNAPASAEKRQTAVADEDDPLFNAVAAEFALEQGDLAGAAAYLVRAAELQEDAATAERATQLAFAAGDRELIQRAVRRWLALAPDAIGPRQAEAIAALHAGEMDKARQALDRLLALSERQGWVAAVQALAHGGELALPLLRQLAAAGRLPHTAEALVVFSQLAERIGDASLARELAERARRNHPQDVQAWLWEAELRRRGGDVEGAIEQLREALRLQQGDGREALSLALAGILAERGLFAEAQTVLRAAGSGFQVMRMRAAVAARAADFAASEELYRELRQQHALVQSEEGRLLLGQLAELLRRSDEALAWYGQLSPESEQWREGRRRTALLLAQGGKIEQALAVAEEDGIAEDPVAEALLKSEILQRGGRLADALSVLEQALGEAADERSLLYAKGLLLERLDRVEEAITVFRRLVELDPEDPSALNALGYTLADRTDQLDEAYELIERALAARPDEPAFIDSMGWVLFRMGRVREALPYLERAFALQPDAEVAAHLGEVLWVLGEQERARAVWGRGEAIDPEHRVLRATLKRLLGE